MGTSSDPIQDGSDEQQKRSEIYTYEAPWHIYAMNWSIRRDKKYRLAITSLLEQYPNRVEIVQLDESNGEIRSDPNLSFEHPYPPTKTIFIPDKECQRPDLLATSSDFLRLWCIADDHSRVELKSCLSNKNSEFCGPLTSFDWNEAEPRRIGTSSTDTTCTIWDIEREAVDTQLIAHDKEVFDIAWGGVGVFASVSADGSVRVFDLRDKEHSMIIYESSEPDTPLVRLGWNKQDPRYMATIIMDSAKVVVLDIRFPALPVVELQRHQASVNAIAWAPHSSCHICTAGDDSQALIWDIPPWDSTLKVVLTLFLLTLLGLRLSSCNGLLLSLIGSPLLSQRSCKFSGFDLFVVSDLLSHWVTSFAVISRGLLGLVTILNMQCLR